MRNHYRLWLTTADRGTTVSSCIDRVLRGLRTGSGVRRELRLLNGGLSWFFMLYPEGGRVNP